MATSRLSTRRVEWRVQVGTSNKAAQGLVIFEASVSYIPDPLAAGGPRTAIPEPVAAVLDAGGYACTPDPTNPAKAGERGAELFTTDSLGADGGDWTWTARPQLRSVNGIQMSEAVPAFSFAVPTGTGSLDLATVQKVPASPGLGTEAAVALVERAEKAVRDAKDAVLNSVDDAAAGAVNAALDDAGLMRGVSAVGNAEPVFSITDESGRRSWLEIDAHGSPTAHAVDKIKGTLPALPEELSEESGWVFAIADSEGKVAAGVRSSGAWETPGAVPRPSVPTQPVTEQLPIIGWGSSLMQGTTGNGTTLLTAIADKAGVPRSTLINMGKSGMRSVGIAARQGGQPAVLSVTGGVIPASGSVGVNAGANHVDVFHYWNSTSVPGTLAGVPGTLTYAIPAATSADATFTRTTPGPAVQVAGPRPFLPDSATTYADNKLILWIGRNNIADPDRVVADYKAIIARAGHHDILVISELDGPNVDVFNNRLAAEFPHYFVDLKAWLIANGLAAAGVTPTSTDTTDIAAGRVPTSLMNDPTHPNAKGYTASGVYLAPILTLKGWL